MNEEQVQLPPELTRILDELYQQHQLSQAPLSLARLSKRTMLRMSTLRRLLTALDEAGIVTVVIHENGTGTAMLTTMGILLHG